MNNLVTRQLIEAAMRRNPFISRSLTGSSAREAWDSRAGGFAIIGPTGAGKSALVKTYLESYFTTGLREHWAVSLTYTEVAPRTAVLLVINLWDRLVIEIACDALMPEWRVVDTLVKLADRRGKPHSILLDSNMLCQDLTGWAKRNDIELRLLASVCPGIPDPAERALSGPRQ